MDVAVVLGNRSCEVPEKRMPASTVWASSC